MLERTIWEMKLKFLIHQLTITFSILGVIYNPANNKLVAFNIQAEQSPDWAC